ncbi:PilX N-terminal domain-containing pilus assembly protein [Steroidobacter sp.]|uniref:pilus assembly PilX family protein n=1 Tax=Steroidobacter sp. TaxID=1978227 RepID=UPI001A5B47A5|nr:PilX N-terminal domain-containing pilus assembly protein [Steroidobacter sp.]MBL8269237.1 hypothetical protein [Steroidobacter sp.]
MKHPSNIASSRQQRGAVLIVSMLLLLVVTILALGAGQSTRLQERMAGTQRNYDLAFQAAEAALRAGERIIDNNALTAPPLPCVSVTSPPCQVYELGFLNGQVSYQEQAFASNAWWDARAQRYSGDTTNLIAGAANEGLAKWDPQFYIEEVEEVPDSLSIPPTGPPPSRVYYRIVARGKGGTDNSQVVLHSTYVRRFN